MSQTLTSLHGRRLGLVAGGSVRSQGLTFSPESVVNVTASTLAVKPDFHAGKLITLNRAAGIAVTLPAATGSGDAYEFVVGTTVTSNTTTIKVANASDVFVGFVIQAADGGATSNVYETASTDDTLTLDGSTKGGIKGDLFRLRDVKLDGTTPVWLLEGVTSATGVEASPLSATV